MDAMDHADVVAQCRALLAEDSQERPIAESFAAATMWITEDAHALSLVEQALMHTLLDRVPASQQVHVHPFDHGRGQDNSQFQRGPVHVLELAAQGGRVKQLLESIKVVSAQREQERAKQCTHGNPKTRSTLAPTSTDVDTATTKSLDTQLTGSKAAPKPPTHTHTHTPTPVCRGFNQQATLPPIQNSSSSSAVQPQNAYGRAGKQPAAASNLETNTAPTSSGSSGILGLLSGEFPASTPRVRKGPHVHHTAATPSTAVKSMGMRTGNNPDPTLGDHHSNRAADVHGTPLSMAMSDGVGSNLLGMLSGEFPVSLPRSFQLQPASSSTPASADAANALHASTAGGSLQRPQRQLSHCHSTPFQQPSKLHDSPNDSSNDSPPASMMGLLSGNSPVSAPRCYQSQARAPSSSRCSPTTASTPCSGSSGSSSGCSDHQLHNETRGQLPGTHGDNRSPCASGANDSLLEMLSGEFPPSVPAQEAPVPADGDSETRKGGPSKDTAQHTPSPQCSRHSHSHIQQTQCSSPGDDHDGANNSLLDLLSGVFPSSIPQSHRATPQSQSSANNTTSPAPSAEMHDMASSTPGNAGANDSLLGLLSGEFPASSSPVQPLVASPNSPINDRQGLGNASPTRIPQPHQEQPDSTDDHTHPVHRLRTSTLPGTPNDDAHADDVTNTSLFGLLSGEFSPSNLCSPAARHVPDDHQAAEPVVVTTDINGDTTSPGRSDKIDSAAEKNAPVRCLPTEAFCPSVADLSLSCSALEGRLLTVVMRLMLNTRDDIGFASVFHLLDKRLGAAAYPVRCFTTNSFYTCFLDSSSNDIA